MNRNLLIAAALCVFAIGMNNASAAATGANCMDIAGCSSAITLDGGNGKVCIDADNTSCSCAEYAAVYSGQSCPYSQVTTNCSSGWSWTGAYATSGKKCCWKTNPNQCQLSTDSLAEADTSVVSNEQSTSDNQQYLENAFSDDMNALTGEVYFGFVGTTLRSPNNGRGTKPLASLDACLGHEDIAAYEAQGGDNQAKYDRCIGGTWGCTINAKNEHCRNNSYAVCLDRCECVYGIGTCDNL